MVSTFKMELFTKFWFFLKDGVMEVFKNFLVNGILNAPNKEYFTNLSKKKQKSRRSKVLVLKFIKNK